MWKKTLKTIHQLSCFVGHPVPEYRTVGYPVLEYRTVGHTVLEYSTLGHPVVEYWTILLNNLIFKLIGLKNISFKTTSNTRLKKCSFYFLLFYGLHSIITVFTYMEWIVDSETLRFSLRLGTEDRSRSAKLILRLWR